MITITLKGIPKRVHSALKDRARQHGRSLNREALACLEAVVAPARVDVHTLLEAFRAHRTTLSVRLDDELLNEARTTGRP